MTQVIGFRKTPIDQKIPGINLPGWTTDISSVINYDLLEFIQPCSIPLTPSEHYLPFGKAHEAGVQLRKWHNELGTKEIIPLLVPDRSQEKLWLFAPVKIDNLRQNLDVLMGEYKKQQKNSVNALRLRATIIAKTGLRPEKINK